MPETALYLHKKASQKAQFALRDGIAVPEHLRRLNYCKVAHMQEIYSSKNKTFQKVLDTY